MSSQKVRAHVIVYGRVQGVNFRYETQRTANRKEVLGWVRNLPDGSVEAVFEGLEADVQAVLNWCEEGSPAARVDKLEVTWLAAEERFNDFEIRY